MILFELLTGDTPLSAETLRSAALDEMLRMIRESEPPRPSSRVAGATEIIRTAATTRGTEQAKLKDALEFIQRAETGWAKAFGPEHPFAKRAKADRARIEAALKKQPQL